MSNQSEAPAEHQASATPTTTAAEDVTAAGQRRVNLIWEHTQAVIAMGTIGVTLICYAIVVLRTLDIQILSQLNLLSGMVIGFYFSRTNHVAIGGVGVKPQGKYEGR